MGLSEALDTRHEGTRSHVTWLTKHKDTSGYEHKVRRHLAPLVVVDTNKASLASE